MNSYTKYTLADACAAANGISFGARAVLAHMCKTSMTVGSGTARKFIYARGQDWIARTLGISSRHMRRLISELKKVGLFSAVVAGRTTRDEFGQIMAEKSQYHINATLLLKLKREGGDRVRQGIKEAGRQPYPQPELPPNDEEREQDAAESFILSTKPVSKVRAVYNLLVNCAKGVNHRQDINVLQMSMRSKIKRSLNNNNKHSVHSSESQSGFLTYQKLKNEIFTINPNVRGVLQGFQSRIPADASGKHCSSVGGHHPERV